MYGAAMSIAPGLLLTAAEALIPMIVAAFIADSDEGLCLSEHLKLTNSFPSASHLQKCIMDYAVDCLIEVTEDLQKAEHVFLTCDKGNKKGLGHFVKILSWWDDTLEKVRTFTLDIDASEGDSSSCGDAIQHSLGKLYAAIKVLGLLTYSGGMFGELKKRGLCQ